MNAPRSRRVDVDGWIVLDKPAGITSTAAVSRLKWLFNARKAGHAGTLDPLASGILPVAFGEATKTVPYVQDGEKAYRFSVRWGEETDTDDAEGAVVRVSAQRPSAAEIERQLPLFTGAIMQAPPAFSAIKVDGRRAYDLARGGEPPELAARVVDIHALRLVEAGADDAVFEAECGKGTYVRAIARDMGRALGCAGHVSALRRTRVGPFVEADAAALADLLERAGAPAAALRPIEAGLAEIARFQIDRDGAARLRRGQPVLLRGRDAPVEGEAYAVCGGVVIAVGRIAHGELVPARVFNSPF